MPTCFITAGYSSYIILLVVLLVFEKAQGAVVSTLSLSYTFSEILPRVHDLEQCSKFGYESSNDIPAHAISYMSISTF